MKSPANSNLNSASSQKWAIVGGGLSGLSLAYYLNQHSQFKVTVFEKDEWGGLIQTIHFEGEQVELAANGFLAHPEVLKLAEEIGASVVSAPRKLNRYIFREGRPRRWPLSFWGSLLLPWIILRFLFFRWSLKPLPKESMKKWGYRVFNKEITDYLLEPAMRGIFAGDLSQLSASIWFQRFEKKKPQSTSAEKKSNLEQNQKLINNVNQSNPSNINKIPNLKSEKKIKGLVSFAGGMGEFLNKLKSHIEKNPNMQLVREKIENLEELIKNYDGVVICTAPPQAAALLRSTTSSEYFKILSQIEMRKIISATLFLETDHPVHGYGCLFPEKENFDALGILWSRDIFSAHGKTPVERWMLLWDGQMLDAEILSLIQKNRHRLYGQELPFPKKFHIQKWNEALPHLTCDLENGLPYLVEPIQTVNGKKVFLHGNYLGKMGTTDLILRSKELSSRIASSEKI